jgi:predicted DNA-binding protein (UPF0251 family)
MPRRWRQRRGQRGRQPKPIMLDTFPRITRFTPTPPSADSPIVLDLAELEALRLVDLEGLSQEEAGSRMEVSRGTVWRLLQAARKKIAQALTEVRPLDINQ